jgi:hypothetical protein
LILTKSKRIVPKDELIMDQEGIRLRMPELLHLEPGEFLAFYELPGGTHFQINVHRRKHGGNA